VWFLAFLL